MRTYRVVTVDVPGTKTTAAETITIANGLSQEAAYDLVADYRDATAGVKPRFHTWAESEI